jgi:hypothetical protein
MTGASSRRPSRHPSGNFTGQVSKLLVTEIIPPEPCAEEKFIVVNGGAIFNHNPLEIRQHMSKI